MKKLLGEKDVEAILQRIDRLTLDEARTTAAQSLEAIYGLVRNMRTVWMVSKSQFAYDSLIAYVVPSRWQSNGKRCPRGSWYV